MTHGDPDLAFDRLEIERYLRRDIQLHLYETGDLDDFFWPYTTWFAERSGGEIIALALLYRSPALPTLLALSRDPAPMRALLARIAHRMPSRFYAHLSPGVATGLSPTHALRSHGLHRKMALTDPSPIAAADTEGVEPLTPSDAGALQDLYAVSYPGNWFDRRMLETGQYVGIRAGDRGPLVSVAGVHVYSAQHRVAALGNVTTHPDHRQRGLGRRATAALCRSLLRTTDHIGLNVSAENAGAIRLYESLGFAIVADYEESEVQKR